MSAIGEAIAIRRRLAADNPDAYEPDLATSLWATAWVLVSGPEDLSRALEAAAESVEIFTKLAERMPAAYQARLRAAKGTRNEVLKAMGRAQQAAYHEVLQAEKGAQADVREAERRPQEAADPPRRLDGDAPGSPL
ncbi:hypothetical protein [Streptomyces sp. NPDC021622]|uniref:hypothetical protein n=1 Tax=Streptomyces sp. NPDC021622 TaxID=3155013 RepID=UPI0033EA37F5